MCNLFCLLCFHILFILEFIMRAFKHAMSNLKMDWAFYQIRCVHCEAAFILIVFDFYFLFLFDEWFSTYFFFYLLGKHIHIWGNQPDGDNFRIAIEHICYMIFMRHHSYWVWCLFTWFIVNWLRIHTEYSSTEYFICTERGEERYRYGGRGGDGTANAMGGIVYAVI